ncbi:hypothetical protein K438DRAFT_1965116 [Mycena galopus ATCC 62051]|nr:hypothetical protein K438DRAFT_1965116 [Mycena galopus ATCC 62051]
MPPELKLMIYYHMEIADLLAVSHVSTFWRAVVLGDRRWNLWFDMIMDPESGHSAQDIMTRRQVIDAIPKRTIVNLCFDTTCYFCYEDTPYLFLPLLKARFSDVASEYAVMAVSTALTAFDLNEKDIEGMLIVRSPHSRHEQIRLVSAVAAKNVAIGKFGGEDKLERHLENRKARSQQAYDTRAAEYDAAINERERLKANGDLTGAEAVTLKNKKKIPNTRPKIPPILKQSCTLSSYQALCIMATNFLAVEAGTVLAHSLVRCEICLIMYNAQPTYPYPERMHPESLLIHERIAHYVHEFDSCTGGSARGSCLPCLNRYAVRAKREQDRLKALSPSS